jgi:hypothetical protein
MTEGLRSCSMASSALPRRPYPFHCPRQSCTTSPREERQSGTHVIAPIGRYSNFASGPHAGRLRLAKSVQRPIVRYVSVQYSVPLRTGTLYAFVAFSGELAQRTLHILYLTYSIHAQRTSVPFPTLRTTRCKTSTCEGRTDVLLVCK